MLILKKVLLFFALIFLFESSYSQSRYQFYGKEDVKQKLSFKLINNLIVIPVQVNGQDLSFILDTGVNKTILFNLSDKDSIGLNQVRRIKLKGLGNGKPVHALISKNNNFRVSKIVNYNEDLYVILREDLNFSAKMGVAIHGIIGYNLLKDVIVKINYKTKTLTFYNPKKYEVKSCRKCETFDLKFFRNKPYINTAIQLDTVGEKLTNTKLLIDSGGSDALWLFEETKEDIKTPKKFFNDILGEGLSGTIYGNRSKVPKFVLGKYVIKEPTVSFLDTTTTVNARVFKDRNGSIGGAILRRFKVWLDYPNKKVVFKKNSSLKKGFYYNMSGLVVVYDGQQLIKEEEQVAVKNPFGLSSSSELTSDSDVFSFVSKFSYNFKPLFKIQEVIEGSPAHEVGLLKDDVITKINGKSAHLYTLDEINGMFVLEPNLKVTLEIERDGIPYKYKFKLKRRI